MKKKNRIRKFAWMLACAMAVTSVPSTGTMVYASEDLFSDGGTEKFEPVEDVSVFNDGSAENTEENISEDIWSADDESEIAVTSDWDYDFEEDDEGGGLVSGLQSRQVRVRADILLHISGIRLIMQKKIMLLTGMLVCRWKVRIRPF